MKKIFFTILILLFCLNTNAMANSYTDALNKIDRVLNTVDRTESLYNRVKNKVPTINTNNNSPSNEKIVVPGNKVTPTTEVDNDIPEYSVEQTIQEGNYKYNQDRVYKGTATTLENLPAGTIVMDPNSVWKFRNGSNYSGDIIAEYPVFWLKLEDNHYTQGSTLLLSEVSVADYPFCHSRKGIRAWDESDVRRFLKTTFYSHLSEGFKNAIINVNIPFADLNGAPKTINENLFLLSIVEWGLSDRANNGNVIKYDNLPKIYGTRDFKYHPQDNFGIAYYSIGGYYGSNLTRTINRPKAEGANYNGDVFIIQSHGVLSDYWYGSNSNVRPAVNLKSSTKVKGPYKFVYDNRWTHTTKTMIYYVLDFSGNSTSETPTNNTTNTNNYIQIN